MSYLFHSLIVILHPKHNVSPDEPVEITEKLVLPKETVHDGTYLIVFL